MILIKIHILFFVISYAAFLTAFVTGILFLMQERQLKHKHMGVLFHRLPPLDQLDRANFLAIGYGFWLLTVGVLSGYVGAQLKEGRWWSGDPGEWLMIAIWAGYFVLWMIRLRASLRGHRVAVLSMLGFGLILLTVLGMQGLLPTWHKIG